MGFEWDRRKNRGNEKKHGIRFEQAARIFQGPTVERIDDRKDYGETRICVFGVYDDTVLAVVYTWRGENRRIISARRASSAETRKYRRKVREA